MENRPTNRVIQVVHHSRTRRLSIQLEHVPNPMTSAIDRLEHVPSPKLNAIDRSGRGRQLAMELIHAIIQDRMEHQDRMKRQDRMASRRFRLVQQYLDQRVRHGQDPMVRHSHRQDLHQERHVSPVSSRCYRWQQPKQHIQINTYKSKREQNRRKTKHSNDKSKVHFVAKIDRFDYTAQIILTIFIVNVILLDGEKRKVILFE